MQHKLTEILRGRVGYVIGGLRQILTKRRLRKSVREALAANQAAGRAPFSSMAPVSCAWMAAALALSVWAAHRMKPRP